MTESTANQTHHEARRASGSNYFDDPSFPLTLLRVHSRADNKLSHPNDLTGLEHSHDFAELSIVTGGRALHHLEGKDYPISAGDVFVVQGRQSHYYHQREELKLINILYDQRNLQLPLEQLRKIPGYSAVFLLEPGYRQQHQSASLLHLPPLTLAKVEQLADRLHRELEGEKAGWEAMSLALFSELLCRIARSYDQLESREAKSLLRVGEVISRLERFPEKPWQLDELADIAGLSRSHFTRVFRRATGRSAVDYLLRLRLRQALRQLQESDNSITDIALQCGFSDSNYFSRQFRRFTGISPSRYRREGGELADVL